MISLQNAILERATPRTIEGREVRITTPEDLIVLKMVFHRPKDLEDIRAMLWHQRGKLDLVYLRSAAASTLEDDRISELEGFIRDYHRD